MEGTPKSVQTSKPERNELFDVESLRSFGLGYQNLVGSFISNNAEEKGDFELQVFRA